MAEVAPYRNSSSVLLARESDRGPEVLLHEHKTHGVWLHPGGKHDPQENTLIAALRELEEETSYILGRDYNFLNPTARILESTDTVIHLPVPAQTNILKRFNMVDDMYLARVHTEAEPSADLRSESTTFAWACEEELVKNTYDIVPNVRASSLWLVQNMVSMQTIEVSEDSLILLRNATSHQ